MGILQSFVKLYFNKCKVFCDRFVEQGQPKGLSPNTVNAMITVVQNSLKTAYALVDITEYHADKIKRPKIQEKKVECFFLLNKRRLSIIL